MPLNRKLKFILEIALLLGTAVGMAIIISFGITAYLGGSAHPTVAVTTGSMLPIYNGFQDSKIYPFRGDILLVKKVPVESIELGDVIVFDTPSVPEPVVHRVIDKWFENNSYFFKTNGDNNDNPDQWIVLGKDVYGVVVLRLPHVGWFLLVIQTTAGKILVLALVILLLFIGDDSEEEKDKITPEEKKDQNASNSNTEKSKLLKIKDLANKTIQHKKGIYAIFILLILLTFIGSNLVSAMVSSPSVKIYTYNFSKEERIVNLLESTDANPFTISTYYQWFHGENSTQKVYFFPVQLEIRSGGLLNNIEKIEILTQTNETEGLYRWTIVYNFVGTRVFEGGIIAFLTGIGTYDATITLIVYSRGLFASPDQSWTFPLILQSR